MASREEGEKEEKSFIERKFEVEDSFIEHCCNLKK